jgi:F-type H+-transporting ATPase subunit b
MKELRVNLRFIVFFIPTLVLASNESSIADTDIVVRTINFTIFVAILYYFVAGVVKDFFIKRTESITDRLSALESKIQESKDLKDKATSKVNEAKNSAKEIIELANKEIEMETKRLEDGLKTDIEYLEKSFKDKREILSKKVKSEIVDEVINELFNGNKGIVINEDDLVTVVEKRVA